MSEDDHENHIGRMMIVVLEEDCPYCKIATLKKSLAVAKEALCFYTDSKNYKRPGQDSDSKIEVDDGKKARAALASLSGEDARPDSPCRLRPTMDGKWCHAHHQVAEKCLRPSGLPTDDDAQKGRERRINIKVTKLTKADLKIADAIEEVDRPANPGQPERCEECGQTKVPTLFCPAADVDGACKIARAKRNAKSCPTCGARYFENPTCPDKFHFPYSPAPQPESAKGDRCDKPTPKHGLCRNCLLRAERQSEVLEKEIERRPAKGRRRS